MILMLVGIGSRDILKMADITVLPEFSRDGDKRSDGLTELNGSAGA
jgi:hypothetical protein